MEIRDRAGQTAVDLLRERIRSVVGAQPRFDVPDGDLAVEGREAADERRGRVPLDEHHVRADLAEDMVQCLDGVLRDLGQGLPGAHDVQIVVRRDLEDVQDLIQHLPVLRGRDRHHAKEPLFRPEADDHRSELDGVGTGPEDDGDRFPGRTGHALVQRSSRDIRGG